MRGFASCGISPSGPMAAVGARWSPAISSMLCAEVTWRGTLLRGVPSRRTAVEAAEGEEKVIVAESGESGSEETGVRVWEVILPQKEKKLVNSLSEVLGEMLLTWTTVEVMVVVVVVVVAIVVVCYRWVEMWWSVCEGGGAVL